MEWDEVERIEVEPDEPEPHYRPLGAKMALVLVGGNKGLSLPGPNWWHGGDRQEMIRQLLSKIEERGIEIRKTRSALWRLPRNTKAPRTHAAVGAGRRP